MYSKEKNKKSSGSGEKSRENNSGYRVSGNKGSGSHNKLKKQGK